MHKGISGFSILIPSWNNLSYLKLCIGSIKRNSTMEHQIIVHANEANDGTLQWLKESQIEFTHSDNNIGICKAMNLARRLAKNQFLYYLNDDMVVLPGWDIELKNRIELKDSIYFYMSSTMIEPVETGNNAVIYESNAGNNVDNFNESYLTSKLSELYKPDWNGATWPPSLMHIDLWDQIGGYSIEFSPGMYSDPDISMKLWKLGVRDFHGVGNSLVFHFAKISTGRVKQNNGYWQFFNKWGLTTSQFYRNYIKMGSVYLGKLEEANELTLVQKLKNRIKASLKI